MSHGFVDKVYCGVVALDCQPLCWDSNPPPGQKAVFEFLFQLYLIADLIIKIKISVYK